jgi:hypothetical protein
LLDGLLELDRRIPHVMAARARHFDHLRPDRGEGDEARGADHAVIRIHESSLARLAPIRSAIQARSNATNAKDVVTRATTGRVEGTSRSRSRLPRRREESPLRWLEGA